MNLRWGPRDSSEQAGSGATKKHRKPMKKQRSEPLGALESLLRSHWGLETASRALREASRRLQERSGRPSDASKSALENGSKSAPGGFQTAPRALWEASRRLQEHSGRLQHRSKSAAGGSKTPSRMLQDASHVRVSSRALLRLLQKSQHQAYLDLGLNVTPSGRSETHSKNLFDSNQLDSASFVSTVSVHVYARIQGPWRRSLQQG